MRTELSDVLAALYWVINIKTNGLSLKLPKFSS